MTTIDRDFDLKDLQQVLGKQCKTSILEGYKGANKCKSKLFSNKTTLFEYLFYYFLYFYIYIINSIFENGNEFK